MSKKIWIDPGHGGADSGALGEGRTEKEDNLTLALEVKRQFANQGCEVIMTRQCDVTLSLSERTAIENRAGCDLALSLHRNGFGDPKANGVEVWLSAKAPDSSVAWGKEMVEGLSSLRFFNRGVKKGFRSDANADYAVNRDTRAPSMLVEMGFISNAHDNEVFDRSISAMAQVIVKSSLKFLGQPYLQPAQADLKTGWQGEPDPDALLDEAVKNLEEALSALRALKEKASAR